MGHYKTAAICKNGHIVTSDISNGLQSTFCKQCGMEVISQCQNNTCNAAIQGKYEVPGVINLCKRTSPSYCHACGKPYPWTEKKIQAAKMLVEDMDELSQEDKKKLSENIDNIITDTPLTEVSANRIKKGLMKVSKETAKAFRDILVSIASEVAKKSLGL